MSTTYEIQVIQRDRSNWRAELDDAVTAELRALGLHRSVSVEVTETPTTSDAPTTAAYLGSPGAAADAGVIAEVEKALAGGVVVVPVVEDLDRFAADVPAALELVNGFAWTGANPSQRLARVLLAELGIEERQRGVFISHKRDDGLGAAEQLHDELSHHGFTPFIDRFAIRLGRDVQDAIADALEDHAFLLLLETPLAHTSPWVFDEVEYALTHTMGTLIVRWPNDVTPMPGSHYLPRLTLAPGDLDRDPHGYDILAPAALDRVVAAAEDAHAYGLVRRRRMLIRSVEEAAAASGATACVPLRDWRLLVEHPAASTLLGITPRLPTARDLQLLDTVRESTRGDPSAVLVHSARALRDGLATHLTWVAGQRELELTPENAIGARWT